MPENTHPKSDSKTTLKMRRARAAFRKAAAHIGEAARLVALGQDDNSAGASGTCETLLALLAGILPPLRRLGGAE